MKMLYKSILLAAGVMLAGVSKAQEVQVSAAMDSAAIQIGEQTVIHLEVTQNVGRTVQFPFYQDTIMKGIELIAVSPLDTVRLSDDRFTVKQDLLITSFDSALYYMPPFRFIAGQDTLLTNSLPLKVSTYEVDTESKEFFDIKPIKSAPFVFMDYYWNILGVLIILFIIVWSLYLYKRWKFRKDHPEMVEKLAPKLPPHVTAMGALEDLKTKKLWQKGLEKEYYTSITDILRNYIEERYHIMAMEMTSAEILDALRKEETSKSAFLNLKQVLELADFVKFAKVKPLPDENELSLINAEMFVSQTVEVPTMDTTEATEKAADA